MKWQATKSEADFKIVSNKVLLSRITNNLIQNGQKFCTHLQIGNKQTNKQTPIGPAGKMKIKTQQDLTTHGQEW